MIGTASAYYPHIAVQVQKRDLFGTVEQVKMNWFTGNRRKKRNREKSFGGKKTSIEKKILRSGCGFFDQLVHPRF